MALIDILRPFHKVQPVGQAVTPREFVDAQLRLAQAIDSLVSFCRGAYERVVIKFYLSAATAGDADYATLENDGKGDWEFESAAWISDDTGDPSAVIKLDWGAFDGGASPGSFTTAKLLSVLSFAGANIASQGLGTLPTTTNLPFSNTELRSLRAYVDTADADAGSFVPVTVVLRRRVG
jgi:hypothetical protein